MDRRAFLGIVALLAAPRAAAAQEESKVPRIGILGTAPPGTSVSLQPFQKGLQDLGYVEGQHVHLDYRWPASGSHAAGYRGSRAPSRHPCHSDGLEGSR